MPGLLHGEAARRRAIAVRWRTSRAPAATVHVRATFACMTFSRERTSCGLCAGTAGMDVPCEKVLIRRSSVAARRVHRQGDGPDGHGGRQGSDAEDRPDARAEVSRPAD